MAVAGVFYVFVLFSIPQPLGLILLITMSLSSNALFFDDLREDDSMF